MRAVLVFCEGMHDVVFVTRSLGQSGGTWVDDPIDQLPTPFGRGRNGESKSFIVQLYGRRNLGERPIHTAAHASRPSFSAAVRHEPSDTLYLLLQSDADRSSDDVVYMLDLLTPTLATGRFDVHDLATAFVFDADGSLAQRVARFRALYSKFFGDLADLVHGSWRSTSKGPLGLFVFHDAITERGTLETLLGPIVEGAWPARWSGAGAFIDQHAEASDPVRKNASEELKARITIAGQIQCPGDPMSIVLGRNGLPASCFSGPHSRQLADFLLAVPWT